MTWLGRTYQHDELSHIIICDDIPIDFFPVPQSSPAGEQWATQMTWLPTQISGGPAPQCATSVLLGLAAADCLNPPLSSAASDATCCSDPVTYQRNSWSNTLYDKENFRKKEKTNYKFRGISKYTKMLKKNMDLKTRFGRKYWL